MTAVKLSAFLGEMGFFLWLAVVAISATAPQSKASLRVHWTNVNAAASESISLLPVDVDLPPGWTREQAIDDWTRRIEGSEQQWDGLPSGTYQVVVRAANSGSGAQPPVDVGEVLLAPGERRTLTISLPLREAELREVRVVLPLEGLNDALTVLQWHGGTPRKLEYTTLGTTLTLRTSCAAGDILQVQTSERIGTAPLDGQCTTPISLALTKRVDVTAQIAIPAGVAEPSWGTLRGENCDAFESPFRVVKSRINTSAPAGCSQLSIRLSGFTPVTVPFKNNLGTIALNEGAAAAARVRGGRDGALLPGVRVRAVREHDVAVMRSESEIDRLSIATAVTDSSGWVRLANLPEEGLVFVLQAPGRRYPQFSEPYAFKRGTETILKDLRFIPPSNVLVSVSLAKNLEGAVELRDVELSSAGHSRWPSRTAIRGELTASGAVVEDVPPGTWKVSATGRLRNGFAIRAAETTVDVTSGLDAYVALDIHDTLYRGRITRDGQPVGGTVNLKPAQRGEGRHAVATADADGTFLVLLEQEGDYSFSLQEKNGNGVRLDHYLHFGRAEDEVEIELPEHRIRGRVVDASGTGIPGTFISANQELADPAGMAASRNAADGQFEIVNVGSGTWSVVAENKSGRSEPVLVMVNGGDVEGVTLVLEPIRTVHVRLVDITGAPIRDAIIDVGFPIPNEARSKSIVRSTNGDGTAEFRVSETEQTTPVSLIVLTLDMRLFCSLTRLDADQMLQLPLAFGEVRLSGPRLQNGVTDKWLLSSSGCSVPFIGKGLEKDSSGEPSFVFSRLAGGTWTYVETRNPEERTAVLTGRGAMLRPVRTFTVNTGAAVRVRLPER